MRITSVLIVGGLLLALNGCAGAGLAIVGAGAGVGMGAGVEYTMDGIAYKTFSAPINNVRFATLKTFNKMGMPVASDKATQMGWELTATATDRKINVELESLTPKTTRMRVVADEGQIFFKDKATESEIIIQTAQELENGEKHADTNSLLNREGSGS